MGESQSLFKKPKIVTIIQVIYCLDMTTKIKGHKLSNVWHDYNI